jgi:hypothetical protein
MYGLPQVRDKLQVADLAAAVQVSF